VSLGTDIIDIMEKAEARGFDISEITLSEGQRDFLAVEFNPTRYPRDPRELLIFNGARIVVGPNKKQNLVKQLRALADQMEKLL
jgi:hypothetical protein